MNSQNMAIKKKVSSFLKEIFDPFMPKINPNIIIFNSTKSMQLSHVKEDFLIQ